MPIDQRHAAQNDWLSQAGSLQALNLGSMNLGQFDAAVNWENSSDYQAPVRMPWVDLPVDVAPSNDHTPSDSPAVADPIVPEPTAVEAPVFEAPVVEAPAVELKTVEPPAIEPTAVEPKTVGPTAVEPAEVEPAEVEPAEVVPKAVEPKAVEPKAVEPKAVEPKAVEPKAVEPKTVEPKAVEPPVAIASVIVTPIETAVADISDHNAQETVQEKQKSEKNEVTKVVKPMESLREGVRQVQEEPAAARRVEGKKPAGQTAETQVDTVRIESSSVVLESERHSSHHPASNAAPESNVTAASVASGPTDIDSEKAALPVRSHLSSERRMNVAAQPLVSPASPYKVLPVGQSMSAAPKVPAEDYLARLERLVLELNLELGRRNESQGDVDPLAQLSQRIIDLNLENLELRERLQASESKH